MEIGGQQRELKEEGGSRRWGGREEEGGVTCDGQWGVGGDITIFDVWAPLRRKYIKETLRSVLRIVVVDIVTLCCL